MKNAQVSVIIPTYNRATYLPQAISSVLSQTFADFEVVVIDDGSTDNTSEIVRAIRDPRLRYIYQHNRGVAAALNAGWRVARGKYIGRLDSDDIWLPSFLARSVPLLEGDSEFGLVYARAQWMDARGKPLSQIHGSPEKFPGRTLQSILYADFVCPMAVVYRRTLVERVGGYDESLVANEDWDLWIRLAEHCRFGYCNEILAHYRTHA